MRKADAMTRLRATIISLALISGAVVFPSRAQTYAAQPARAPAQQGVLPSNYTPQSGVKPQGDEMKGMPGMEGMLDQTSTLAPTQKEQQSKSPQAGEQQPGQEM